MNETGHAEQPTAADARPGDTRSAMPSLSDRVRLLRLPAQVNAKRRPRRSWLPWTIGLAAVGVAAWFGASALTRESAAPTKKSANATSTVPAVTGDVVLESKGYIIAAHTIQVSPKVGGMILKMDLEEGMRVKRGQVLAQLEITDYQSERDRLRAQLDSAWERYMELQAGYRPEEIKQAKAELDEAEATRKQMMLDFERNRGLNKAVLSPRDYEASEFAFKSADRRVERLKQAHLLMVEGPRQEKIAAAWADMMQIDADLAKAEWRLDNCTVRAPISGTILTKYAEEGNIVNQLSFNLKGSLCDLADLADLEVELKVQERDVAKVFKGQKCRVRCEAYPDRVYDGVVSRLMPIADRSQAAVPVRVKVRVPAEEEGVYLKPEMGAVVSFLRK
jgi:multidrug resistance efflux pump